ncbi:MAG: hypothetical protein HUU04_07210 [Verrucomicrobiae bacterium]|nr:hypothetical protein [Verrucomicrobiae bacterium]
MPDLMKRHGIRSTSPVHRWDEGLPLGNGLLGLLVWGAVVPRRIARTRGGVRDPRRWEAPSK